MDTQKADQKARPYYAVERQYAPEAPKTSSVPDQHDRFELGSTTPNFTIPKRVDWIDRFLKGAIVALSIGVIGIASYGLNLMGLVAPGAPLEPLTEMSATPAPQQIRAWQQTNRGNCATVAAIKCAKTTFGNLAGPNGIFKEAEFNTAGDVTVTMRDGFQCTLTAQEISVAQDSSHFFGWHQDDAVLLYACSAKRAQIERNDGISADASFSDALWTLADGDHGRACLNRLGLKGYYESLPRSELDQHTSVYVSNGSHGFFTTGGWGDDYGHPYKVDTNDVQYALVLHAQPVNGH